MVTIILVPKGTEYKVHKELLASASIYFHNALHGPWVEAEERIMRTEDVDDDACMFALILLLGVLATNRFQSTPSWLGCTQKCSQKKSR
jgi:hypothetical protein